MESWCLMIRPLTPPLSPRERELAPRRVEQALAEPGHAGVGVVAAVPIHLPGEGWAAGAHRETGGGEFPGRAFYKNKQEVATGSMSANDPERTLTNWLASPEILLLHESGTPVAIKSFRM